MRGVIDRFKAMDRFCFVEGDMNGALTLRVENDRYVARLTRHAFDWLARLTGFALRDIRRVNVQTFYTNLIPRLTGTLL